MQLIREYVISVCVSATICSMVYILMKSSPLKHIIKIICGVYILISVVEPLFFHGQFQIDHWELSDDTSSLAIEGGKDYAQESLNRIIIAKTEEYIADKAHALNAEVHAEIQLSDDSIPVPVRICLIGNVSIESKKQLEKMIEYDLGIPKEDQHWIERS